MTGRLWIILWLTVVSASQGFSTTGAWLLLAVPRIADAIDQTRTECEQITAERAAFDAFTKRVAALDPDGQPLRATVETHQSSTDRGITAVVDQARYITDGSTASVEPTPVAEITRAYRETVMAAPHYEEVYDESLNESLAAELGTNVAQTLTENDIVTPQLQATVLARARQASSQRNDLLAHAETEYETLTDMRRRLRELYETAETIEGDLYPRPVRELVQSWNRLETAATDCQTLLRERQKYLQEDPGSGSMTRLSFQEYLYGPFQWRHPVLNDGLDTLTRIRRAKQNTLEAIYEW